MRALDDIAQSLRLGQLHPTSVLNTLIAAENEGGLGAVRQLERQLTRSADALSDAPAPPQPAGPDLAERHPRLPGGADRAETGGVDIRGKPSGPAEPGQHLCAKLTDGPAIGAEALNPGGRLLIEFGGPLTALFEVGHQPCADFSPAKPGPAPCRRWRSAARPSAPRIIVHRPARSALCSTLTVLV